MEQSTDPSGVDFDPKEMLLLQCLCQLALEETGHIKHQLACRLGDNAAVLTRDLRKRCGVLVEKLQVLIDWMDSQDEEEAAC